MNPKHLWIGTKLQNAQDMDAKGRRVPPVGERNGMAKLTGPQVSKIKSLLYAGVEKEEIARQFSISISTIYHIFAGKTWKHIPRGSANESEE